MAQIIPFRGILFNPVKIGDLADVVTPPYDVISEAEQLNFYERHPYNMIRLILGKTRESDTSENNRHTRAAAYFKEWLSKNVLQQDTRPALYLTSVEFSHEKKNINRFGLIANVRLEPFERGIVLPHEKTFSNVKTERLQLMKACHANFSPIFSLYSDEGGLLSLLKGAVQDRSPDIAFIEDNARKHSLWRITDSHVHQHVSDTMKEKTLFIADGHHRYETALNYRDWVARNTPGFSERHPANYVMMYLSSMEDPGLIILPAHRLLSEVPESITAHLIPKAGQFFEIRKFTVEGVGQQAGREEFLAALKSNVHKNALGVFIKNDPTFYLLILKPDVMERMFAAELPESLRSLDVSVLTQLVILNILGFEPDRLDNEKLISYSSSAENAIQSIAAGKFDVAFILNATKMHQVRKVAEEGLIMPRKSTYFYPKVITGQVLNLLI
jgi:uncharacterized protein (DUF1015 family)